MEMISVVDEHHSSHPQTHTHPNGENPETATTQKKKKRGMMHGYTGIWICMM
jgi:hypothetical protein